MNQTLWPRCQDAEYTLASCCALARAKMGSCWSALEVHFEHSEPLDCAPLETAFRTTLRFQQATNRLLMARSDLDRPLREEDADPTVYLQRHIGDLAPRQPQEHRIVDRVELSSLPSSASSVQQSGALPAILAARRGHCSVNCYAKEVRSAESARNIAKPSSRCAPKNPACLTRPLRRC